jgi:centrin-3
VRYGIEPNGWDSDRRGECGPVWREFTLAIFQGIAGSLIAKRDPLDECRRAYRLFDKEGKGMISFEDLRAMAVQIGQPLDDGQIRRMISEFDSDGKGGVNEEEFIRVMMKSRK